jgi:hypothetical protein
MLIDPKGYITLCCQMSGQNRIFNKHISQIDNLLDFFNGQEYNDIRIEFEEKTWKNIPECHRCVEKHNDKVWCTVDHSLDFNPNINKLQYLEFTTSNVCNQTCVMCSSYFSNQWNKINLHFNRNWNDNTYILSDNDIDKICESLTDLKELMIKGGEPFADIRNYKVIKKLLEINDKCIIHIVTNGSLIPEKYMDIIFRNPKRFMIAASVDAIGKRYEWIRGTSWEKTNNTLKELYYQTGVKPSLCPTISTYNIYNSTELINYAEKSEWIYSEGGAKNYFKNDVVWPTWCSPRKVFTQKKLDSINDLPYKIKSEYDPIAFKNNIKYTEVMNNIRGFNINIWGDM